MIISLPTFAGPLNLSQTPLFLTTGQTPLVLLTMARDHKLYYEAYNDYSDLDSDGTLDVGYKPSITYYGYFDSYKCYTYDSGNSLFVPSNITADKTCSGKWSGDFLNYVTMSRMDALRKVLYGGYRSTDTSDKTVLERSFIPQDAHSWGKEYYSIARDGYDITKYTPLSLPATGTYHLFANTTLTSDTSPPLMRVLTNSNYRVWEWLSIERPVAGSECATGNNVRANCEVAGGTQWEIVPSSFLSGVNQSFYNASSHGTSSPSSESDFASWITDTAVSSKLCGTRSLSQINGSGNPFGGAGAGNCDNNSDKYLDISTGTININEVATYKFAVDGDDAVQLKIDGTLVAGWYGGHGKCSDTTSCLDSHSGNITLAAGAHTLTFTHQEGGGGDSYALYWQKTKLDSTISDYTVRVEVCNSSVGLETNCEAYGTSNKPVGLLQNEGEGNAMYFGLLTGSYKHNTEGGVLRKAMSTINNEITSDGRFGSTGENCATGTPCKNGIISTLNKLKIQGFNYSDNSYSCGWITTRQMNDGECEMWGNPIGEMLYEGMRYFAGKTSPTSSFKYDNTDTSITDNKLGLPELTTWTDPYSSTPDPDGTTPTFAACSKPYSLLVSDVYPSFDSNSMPGTPFSTFSGDITEFDVDTLGQTIWNGEFSGSQNIFIGQVGDTYDGAPTSKSASSFGNIRGLAPGEPTRQGTYYSAAAAYYGHTNTLGSLSGSQKLNTYSIALASPLPSLSIPVGDNKITILPFAKSTGGSSISASSGSFQPTNQIVDFYVDTIRNVTGSASDPAINDGRAYYKFRINYEDVEQGADHDMDAVALYEIKLNADDTVSVSISSDYAAGGITQHMGFVISGSTNDGAYLLVRDSDTASGSDQVYFLDCRSGTTNPANCTNGSGDLPTFKELKFTASGSGSASLLKDPLWYAAKWGGFIDNNANQTPDTTEWDADGDGTPDNYFLVTNPLKLEQQLTKALDNIKNDSATAASTATNSFSYQSDSALYQARFTSDGWSGELNAFPINSNGALGAATWQAQYKLATAASRAILTYDPDAVTKGIPFLWDSMTSTGTPYLQTSLNKNYIGTTDNQGSSRVSFLRGNAVTGMRNRPYIKGTTTTNKLGDIVSSQPQYVSIPNFGYASSTYAGFRSDYENRTPMLYVGANDGMLHGFSAVDGTEKIAYIPSEMYRTRNSQPLLSKLTDTNYGVTTGSSNPHNYYVDGTPTTGDVCTATCAAKTDWKTMLVGGLNAGGQGFYALNITNPANFSESNASSLVMWEFNDRNDADLGYTYGRASIAKICTDRVNGSSTTPKECTAGKWVVIFGNGYNNTEADGYASTTGYAALYVVDALTGSLIKKISTNTGSAATPNGLASPAVIDIDSDEYADYVYAGDLQGNMWKFDITSDSTSSWKVAYGTSGSPKPLYTAKDGTNSHNAQKITTTPEAIAHSESGVLVIFGTGSYITSNDNSDTSTQSIYGIWDNGAIVASTDRSNLQQQTISSSTATSGSNTFRTISSNTIDWTTKKGWYIDLPSSGERISYDPRLIGSIFEFTSTVPSSNVCDFGGTSWDYFVDAQTGGRLTRSIFLDVPALTFGAETAYASGVQSTVGITPTGTFITEGKGRGKNYLCGTTGECTHEDLDTGTSGAGRISWREITTD